MYLLACFVARHKRKLSDELERELPILFDSLKRTVQTQMVTFILTKPFPVKYGRIYRTLGLYLQLFQESFEEVDQRWRGAIEEIKR